MYKFYLKQSSNNHISPTQIPKEETIFQKLQNYAYISIRNVLKESDSVSWMLLVRHGYMAQLKNSCNRLDRYNAEVRQQWSSNNDHTAGFN